MTGREVRKIRESMNLNMAEFAALVGVAHVTVWRWENAQRTVSGAYPFLIRSIANGKGPATFPSVSA